MLLLQAVFIALTSVSVADFLPGLLSRKLCELNLNETGVGPICSCLNQSYFDSLGSLCSSLDAASECLETKLRTSVNQHFFTLSFDKQHFLSSMRYLCDLAKEFDDTSECGDNDAVLKCETNFTNHLNNKTLSLEDVCSVFDALSDCYWKELKKVRLCPERAKILYAKLAEASVPNICTKVGNSVGTECQTFYPKIATPYTECVKSVEEKADCLVRERKTSQHHEDIYWEMGFDVSRFIEFSKLTCLIEKERDRECFDKNEAQKNCYQDYKLIFDAHVLMVKNGTPVTEEDRCSVLQNYTRCVEVALRDCPIEVTNLNSLICANMPRSCYCPVRLAEERTARSTGGSADLTTDMLLMLFVSFLISQQNNFQ